MCQQAIERRKKESQGHLRPNRGKRSGGPSLTKKKPDRGDGSGSGRGSGSGTATASAGAGAGAGAAGAGAGGRDGGGGVDVSNMTEDEQLVSPSSAPCC